LVLIFNFEMKISTAIIVCLCQASAWAQPTNPDQGNPISPDTPKGWRAERVRLSAAVAGGVEELRFAPGWNNSRSEQYWTYASLWYLEGTPETNEAMIKQRLTAYYTELIESSAETKKIPAQKVLPVKTWIRELQKEGGDARTYYGAVAMLDYKSQQPISLNCVVHVRHDAERNITVVFFEFSPKPLGNPVWKDMDQLWTDFKFRSDHA
jgi:hypothetical protein